MSRSGYSDNGDDSKPHGIGATSRLRFDDAIVTAHQEVVFSEQPPPLPEISLEESVEISNKGKELLINHYSKD